MAIRQALSAKLAVSGLLAAFAAAFWPAAPASAQSSQFCPTGFTLVAGYCVSQPFTTQQPCPKGMGPVSFGNTFACVGAASAAIASQATSTNVQSITNQSASATLDAVRYRRLEETQGRNASARAIGFAPQESYAADIAPGRMIVRQTAPAAVGTTVSPALWIQGFYDHESRNETTAPTTPTNQAGVAGTLLPPGGLSTTTNLDRTTQTLGFLAGLDFTIRNLFGSGDALVVGALAGYTSSHVKFKNITQSTDLTGPSAGIFAAYAVGQFSTDATFKADFMTQDQQFVDFAGTPGFAPAVGSNSIRLNTYSVAGNMNYRFPLAGNWYFEPTVGAIYADTAYGAGAAQLGLTDTNTTRVQGGARIGDAWQWGTTAVSATLTGIAFSTVNISGGSAPGFGFNAASTSQTDEGKVFGQFLLATNFDFGGGFSASTGGDVRFGHGVVGIGAKGGLRYQW